MEGAAPALLTSDVDGQSSLHRLSDAADGAAVGGDIGQLPGVAGVPGGEEAGQVIHRLGGVEGGVGVADGVHAVPQRDQDGGEEQRQAHLDHRHQDLPLLQARGRIQIWGKGIKYIMYLYIHRHLDTYHKYVSIHRYIPIHSTHSLKR